MINITIDNNLLEIKTITDQAIQFLNSANINHDIIGEIKLMIEEIISNIIKYGYGDQKAQPITAILKIEDDLIIVTIEDFAHPFNPFHQNTDQDLCADIEERPIGGLGILLVKELADYVEYTRHDNKNIVRLAKRYAFKK